MIHLAIQEIDPKWYSDILGTSDDGDKLELELGDKLINNDGDRRLCVPDEIYSLFCKLGHTTAHICFDTYGTGAWSKQSMENAKEDIKYWLEHLDLAMNNGRPWKTIENWYLDYQWKAKFGDASFPEYLPFTRENLKIWLEEFLEFLNQADSSIICMGD